VKHHLISAPVWHVFSRDFTVLPAHPHVRPQSEYALPAFAFPVIAGTHLPTPEGWKAELTWVAGYVLFICQKAVTHPTTNRAQRTVAAWIETLHTKPPHTL